MQSAFVVQLQPNPYLTLVVATLVRLLGRWLIGRVTFLRTYSIPEPVVGGLLVALLVTAVRGLEVEVTFGASLQSPLMLGSSQASAWAPTRAASPRGGSSCSYCWPSWRRC